MVTGYITSILSAIALLLAVPASAFLFIWFTFYTDATMLSLTLFQYDYVYFLMLLFSTIVLACWSIIERENTFIRGFNQTATAFVSICGAVTYFNFDAVMPKSLRHRFGKLMCIASACLPACLLSSLSYRHSPFLQCGSPCIGACVTLPSCSRWIRFTSFHQCVADIAWSSVSDNLYSDRELCL